tara:strand:+ start:11576 stop:11923 length:348 start_codon:yes stop_codon:yes gene_type:complete
MKWHIPRLVARAGGLCAGLLSNTPKARFSMPATKLGLSSVRCTQCYAHNLSCDYKTPYQPCTDGAKDGKRKQCGTYLDFGACFKSGCPFAHPEDGYSNAKNMQGLYRPSSAGYRE